MSALTRMSNSEHKKVSIMPGDTVIISATPIQEMSAAWGTP